MTYTSIFDIDGKDTPRILVKGLHKAPLTPPLEYTPIRRFYAWVGFACLCALTIHGLVLFIADMV